LIGIKVLHRGTFHDLVQFIADDTGYFDLAGTILRKKRSD
jgi:hypothetical protein